MLHLNCQFRRSGEKAFTAVRRQRGRMTLTACCTCSRQKSKSPKGVLDVGEILSASDEGTERPKVEPCNLAFCVSHVAGRIRVLDAAEQPMGFNFKLADWQVLQNGSAPLPGLVGDPEAGRCTETCLRSWRSSWSARWQRREMRIGTRGKAVVQPVSLPSSRTRNVGKATWFSGLSPGVLGVWALLASGLLFRFCFWVSSCRVVLALFGRLSSSPEFVSKKRQRPRAPTQGPGFPTGRPRAERALRGGRERGATTRGPVF